MVVSSLSSLENELSNGIGLFCTPPHWQLPSVKPSPSPSSSSNLAPRVEVLVFSRECGALVLSPCRIHSTIEDRKHLYHWNCVKKKRKSPLFDGLVRKSTDKRNSESSCEPLKIKTLEQNIFEETDFNGNYPSPLIGEGSRPFSLQFKSCLSLCDAVSYWLLKVSSAGSGGFGSVFISKYNNMKVAIKHLHYKRHSSSADFWSLRAELNAFRLPHSPNVVSAISFISCDPFVQIVSEFVRGRDLQKFINDDQWVTTSRERKIIAYEIASGLAHCHSHNLLHLDVKPSNVLLSANLSTCKLTDFGCSRIANEVSSGILIAPDSISTSSFGTVAYKAPELLKSGRPTDRADIYSYSLLLYALLSRRAPYQGLHPHAIIFLVAGRNTRPELDEVKEKFIKEGSNKIDFGLLNLVEMCWVSNYMNRPSAADVCKFLEELSFD